MSIDDPSLALDAAERVADALARHGIPSALIGAAALAVHGYTRATQDLDLGTVGAPIESLRAVAEELRGLAGGGFQLARQVGGAVGVTVLTSVAAFAQRRALNVHPSAAAAGNRRDLEGVLAGSPQALLRFQAMDPATQRLMAADVMRLKTSATDVSLVAGAGCFALVIVAVVLLLRTSRTTEVAV